MRAKRFRRKGIVAAAILGTSLSMSSCVGDMPSQPDDLTSGISSSISDIEKSIEPSKEQSSKEQSSKEQSSKEQSSKEQSSKEQSSKETSSEESFDPYEEIPEPLYGPPPIKTSDVSNEISSEASKIKEKFDSSSNIPQDIYGPPVIEESEQPTEEFEPS